MAVRRLHIAKLGPSEYVHKELLKTEPPKRSVNGRQLDFGSYFGSRRKQRELLPSTTDFSGADYSLQWEAAEPEQLKTEGISYATKPVQQTTAQKLKTQPSQKGIDFLHMHLQLVKGEHSQRKAVRPNKETRLSSPTYQPEFRKESAACLLKAKRNLSSIRFSSLVNGRKVSKVSLGQYYALMQEHNLEQNVGKIVQFYRMLFEEGCAEKKLNRLVFRLLRDKEQLRRILMESAKPDLLSEKVFYEVRKEPHSIMSEFKQVGFLKSLKGFRYLLSQMELFRERLEERVIEQRTRKIYALESSIKQREQTREQLTMRKLYKRGQPRSSRQNMRRMGRTLAELQKCHRDMNLLSSYNMRIFECLSQAENRIENMPSCR